jgi:exosortase/archaeosortase family protein
LSLAAIGIFRSRGAGRLGTRPRTREMDWRLPALALVVYALSFPFLTPLPRAVFGLFSLALTLSQSWYGSKLHAGILGLCWLSIPLMASLEFYVSYPLRVVSAELAEELLQLGGVNVTRLGVNLLANGQEVAVDPACSGLKMLWAGAYATSVLGCLLPLRPKRALLCLTLALVLLVAGNGWRTAALFYSESGMLELPSGAHHAIGFLVFALVLGAVSAIWIHSARKEAGSELAKDDSRAALPPALLAAKAWHARFFVVACLLALTAAFVPRQSLSEPSVREFTGWPDTYAGRPLVAETAPPEVAEFYRRFPGKVAHFRSGSTLYVFRFLTEPTRRLHPAQHCYRASGYDTGPEHSCFRQDGERYGCFTARRGTQKIAVSERIYDVNSGAWTDVSAWYWAAVLGRSQGPWWVVTIAERESESGSGLVMSQP